VCPTISLDHRTQLEHLCIRYRDKNNYFATPLLEIVSHENTFIKWSESAEQVNKAASDNNPSRFRLDLVQDLSVIKRLTFSPGDTSLCDLANLQFLKLVSLDSSLIQDIKFDKLSNLTDLEMEFDSSGNYQVHPVLINHILQNELIF
jgi:hypothetical protein